MSRLTARFHSTIRLPIPSSTRPLPTFLKTHFQIKTKPRRFAPLANNNNNNNNNGLSKDPNEREENGGSEKEKGGRLGSNGGDDSGEDNRRSIFSGIRWSDLLLDPDPDNILAVGLTGLLTWASVQVLWQLLFISFAILVAAIKYSFIAALLIFILITLL